MHCRNKEKDIGGKIFKLKAEEGHMERKRVRRKSWPPELSLGFGTEYQCCVRLYSNTEIKLSVNLIC